ncbi:MAG: PAS domain S-box protein, partial [Candidatus Omnitrophica bacterium]|nr:PAS domain S-box protein [Candidatus Omnitrophota bacterium]
PVPCPSAQTKLQARQEGCFLVLFDEIPLERGAKGGPKGRASSPKDREYLEALEKELAETKEYLRTVTEEHEGANEELKAANEEILASNEELQSANEELETSKEELQSSNEELITTNEEMQNRNTEISILNNDFVNLLGSVTMPIIMMDTGLVIRRATSQAEKVLNIIPSDIGRPISKVRLNVEIPDLEKTLLHVIESLQPQMIDVEDKAGNSYSVYFKPYRTLDNKIDGVVMIFLDITARRTAEASLQSVAGRLEAIVAHTPDHVLVQDKDLRYTFVVNPQLGLTVEDMIGRTDLEILDPKDAEAITKIKRGVIESGKTVTMLVPLVSLEGKTEYFEGAYVPKSDANGNVDGLIGYFRNVTAQKRMEAEVNRLFERQKGILGAVPDIIMEVDSNKVYTWANQAGQDFFGDDVIGREAGFYFEGEQKTYDLVKPVFAGNGEIVYVESWQRRKDGEKRLQGWWCRSMKDGDGKVVGVLSAAQDITDRKKAEEDLEKKSYFLEQAQKLGQIGSWELDVKKNKLLWTDENYRIFGISIGTGLTYELFLDCVHPEDREYVDKEWSAALHGKPYYVEHRLQMKDGSVKWGSQKAELEFDEEGNCVKGNGFAQDITERKRAEEAVRESEERYHDLFNSMVNGFALHEIVLDDKGAPCDYRFLAVNAAFERLTSLKAVDIIGRRILEIAPGTERYWIDTYGKVALTGEACHFEHFSGVQGKYYEVIAYRPTEGRFACVFSDVTERRKAEEALRESEERLRTVLETVEEGIILSDEKGHFLIYNSAMEKLTGYSQEEANKMKDFMKVLYPVAREYDLAVQQLGTLMRENRSQELETVIRRKDGGSCDILTYSVVIFHEGRKLFLTTFRDISQRKKLEETLKESEEKFRVVFDHATDGMSMADPATKRQALCNRQMAQMLGYTQSEYLKLSVEDIHPKADLPYVLDQFGKLVRGEQTTTTLPIMRKDGTVFQADISSSMICVGQHDFLMGIFRDATQRLKAEKQAVDLAATKASAETAKEKMEEVVAAYKELQQAQTLLIQSAKLSALGTLTAGIAHELNNPLAGILEIMRYHVRQDLDDKDHRDFEEVVKAGERMAKIVRGMLDFARPSTGEKGGVNLNSLIEAVLEFTQKIMISQHVDVQKNFEKDLGSIKADEGQIRQVVINLVDNAVDAMQNKGVLKISTRTITVNGTRCVEMEFSDSGSGIKQEDISLIFDPFFTTKRPGKGTGLGLAVTQSIIQQHGGEILVQSPPTGQETGTSFKVRLPVIN